MFHFFERAKSSRIRPHEVCSLSTSFGSDADQSAGTEMITQVVPIAGRRFHPASPEAFQADSGQTSFEMSWRRLAAHVALTDEAALSR